MEKTRDRSQRFALRAFAAAGRAEKNERLIFHGRNSFIPQTV
jgi:hypothetical protein